MKIAIVHDWLTGIGGDVRVLAAISELYPDAPIYCLARNKNFTNAFFPQKKIIPVFQTKRYKFLLPLMATAIESIDLSEYDVVISTGSIFAKGVVVRPQTIHINYCHSPTRQVWDLSQQYKRKLFQHFLRIWDRQAATRVDQFIANSQHVRSRIRKYYHRDSQVIYPPVRLVDRLSRKSFSEGDRPEKAMVRFQQKSTPGFPESLSTGYYLIVSRLFKHKNIDVAVKAFNKLGWPLVIIGEGPEKNRLQALAENNVVLKGNLTDQECADYYANCRAFLMPQEEDFGIAAIEALSHGKPVLALRAGGALEYIHEGKNGLFFDEAHEAVLADGVRRLTGRNWDEKIIKATAQTYSWQNFQSSFSNTINQLAR